MQNEVFYLYAGPSSKKYEKTPAIAEQEGREQDPVACIQENGQRLKSRHSQTVSSAGKKCENL